MNYSMLLSEPAYVLCTLFQECAWPAAVGFSVWFVARAAGDYIKLALAQYNDAQLAETRTIATRALKESKAAREEFTRAKDATEIEVQTLKSALVSRSIG